MFKFYNDIIHHMPEKFNENRSIAHQTRHRPREALTFPACAGKIATILNDNEKVGKFDAGGEHSHRPYI